MALLEDQDPWISELKAALANNCPVENLQSMCFGKKVPESMRSDVWQYCLGLNYNTDKIAEFNEIFDLPFQKTLHESCVEFVDNLGNDDEDKVSVMSDLESILTFYCKTQQMTYEKGNGWIELLMPLLSLRLNRSLTYNLFEAVRNILKPTDSHKKSMFYIFRLLILYHDPELCSMLDTKQINPRTYSGSWFQSLFAATCTLSTVLCIWDMYLLQTDPMQILFLSLTMLLNRRDELLALKCEDNTKIICYLSNIPSALEQDDIPDLSMLARYYSIKTPNSFKLGFEGSVIDYPYDETVKEEFISQVLCLPVSVRELVTSISENISENVRFFLVDCRPAEQYNHGHLPTAFHLDCNLMLQEPNAFGTAVQGLLRAQKHAIQINSIAGGDHLCFMGSGSLEEDQYTHMVVASFLQKNVPFISLLSGGYKTLHQFFEGKKLDCLENHNLIGCLICNKSISDPRQTHILDGKHIIPTIGPQDVFTKFSTTIKSKSAELKEKLFEYVANISEEDAFPNTSKKTQNINCSSLNTLNQPVFSIDDQEDEINASSSINNKLYTKQGALHLATYLKNKDIVASFKCQEIHINGSIHESHLIITSSKAIILRDLDYKGNCQLIAKRPLSTIVKITAKRKHKDLITFKYGVSDGETIRVTDMDRFIIPNAKEATHIISKYIVNSFSENKK